MPSLFAAACDLARSREAVDARCRSVMGLGDRRHGVDDVVGPFLVHRRKVENGAARIIVAALAATELAREKAAREWAPHHHSETLVRDQRQNLLFEFAPRDR